MTIIFKLLINIILLVSILNVSDSQLSDQKREFVKAIDYWTETLCSLENTKTFVFHGIFVNSSQSLQQFFDVLLRTTTEHCRAVVLLKVYTSANLKPDLDSKTEDINTNEKNVRVREQTAIKEYDDTENRTIWEFVSMLDILRHKWDITREWRKKDEYYIDIWRVNIIFLSDVDFFEKLLDSDTSFQWNSREHFFVLAFWNDSSVKSNDRKLLIERTLKKLWLNYQVLNVFFDEPLSRNNNSYLYSYDPFAINSEKARGQLKRVNGSSKRQMLRSLSTLTYTRTANFNGYVLNMSIFNQWQEGRKIQGNIDPNSIYKYSGGYDGPSGILLGVVSMQLNFVVNVVEPNTKEKFGHQMENGTYSGALGDVAYRRAEASFATFFVKKYVEDMSRFEFTTTAGFDEVCVIAPKARKIPKTLRIFYIFKIYIWLCMVVSYIVVYLTWYVMRLLSPLRSKDDRKAISHLRMIYVCTGYPVSLPSSNTERCLLTGIFFCSITLLGIFNGTLYKSFSTDMFFKDILDLTDLDKSGLPIGFSSYSIADIFGTKDDPDLSPLFKSLQKKLIYLPDPVHDVVYNRNATGLLRAQYYPLMKETLIDSIGTNMVHRITDCPARFYLACLLPKNSFLRDRINVIISSMNQGGFTALWRIRTIWKKVLKIRLDLYKKNRNQNKLFVAFQLSDIQVSFFLLGAGLSSSIIVFFLEKIWAMTDSKTRNRLNPEKCF